MHVFTHGIISSSGGAVVNEAFQMTIDTTQSGSASDTFILPCLNVGTYNAVIDWGDGSTSDITAYNDSDLTHVYSVSGIYTVSITGTLPNIYFNNVGDKLKVTELSNWGVLPMESFDRSFDGCANMDITAIGTPDFSSIVRMGAGFSRSGITNFPFKNADFSSCTVWIQGASAFGSCASLNNLDFTGMSLSTSVSLNLERLFINNTSLASVIGFNTINTEKVTSTVDMFRNTVLESIDMSGMDFTSCTSFLRMFFIISELDDVNVTNMLLNTSSNVNMTQMFQGHGLCDIIGLDTWDVSKVNTFNAFMSGTTITTVEYDKLLIAYNNLTLTANVPANFGSSKYTGGGAVATARADIITDYLWTITDGGTV